MSFCALELSYPLDNMGDIVLRSYGNGVEITILSKNGDKVFEKPLTRSDIVAIVDALKMAQEHADKIDKAF